MNGKLALVTGADGFIASHIVQQLLEAGCKVRGSVISLKEPDRYAALYDIHPKAKENLELVEAELMDADAWARAVKGVDYICHLATITAEIPYKNEDEFILPARQGMLNVLRAASQEKSVKRVVVTSSLVAAADIGTSKKIDERCWVQPMDIPPGYAYNKSKIISERTAWAFYESLPTESRFELSTVLPTLAHGPVIYSYKGHTSISLIAAKSLLENRIPYALPLYLPIIDVRDVAKIHIACLTSPEAPGRRFLAFGKMVEWKEFADVLNKEFGPQGYKIATEVPSPETFDAMCAENRQLARLRQQCGTRQDFDNAKTRQLLQWEPIEMNKTMIDSGYGLIEFGAIEKTPQFKGPGKSSFWNISKI